MGGCVYVDGWVCVNDIATKLMLPNENYGVLLNCQYKVCVFTCMHIVNALLRKTIIAVLLLGNRIKCGQHRGYVTAPQRHIVGGGASGDVFT